MGLRIINLEGHQNAMTGSKVTMILMYKSFKIQVVLEMANERVFLDKYNF